jgi:digeranylgeranylglycerophospholipid reductase
MRKKLKVAILGAGLSGLSCALELERNGIVPVIFERDAKIGWMWTSVTFWPNVFYNTFGDTRKYLLEQYKIDFIPIANENSITMKSPNKKIKINGNLGLNIARGNLDNSFSNQLSSQLTQTAVYLNSKEDYKNLSKEYDYVVVATGKDSEAREMGVWEDEGVVNIVTALVNGSFTPSESEIYFDTEYAGTGYGRLSSYNSSSAVIGLYTIGLNEIDLLKNFRDFLRKESLDRYECVVRNILPIFTNGKVNKFSIGNVLLAGRSAGLTERVLGCGGFEALISGTLAARAIANGDDYDKLVKPLQDHVENISSYRKIIDKFTNDDFDKLISALEIPGVKQIIYNTGISFSDIIGSVLKNIQK